MDERTGAGHFLYAGILNRALLLRYRNRRIDRTGEKYDEDSDRKRAVSVNNISIESFVRLRELVDGADLVFEPVL
jgi:hypothetical protein